MRAMFATLVGLMLLSAGPAAALQQAPPTTPQAEAHDEVVVVRGHVDRALDAFMRGDFVTAEEEFKKNLTCVQREERLRIAAIEQAIIDMERGFGPQLWMGAPAPQVYMPPERPHVQMLERTCEGRDWQLYMIALSQIQQGKFAEARDNLDRVTQRSHDPYLFDAYFRLGLIDLQSGDVDRADQHLTRLNRIRRGCVNRSVGCDYIADLEASIDYLTAVIANERRARH